jgi:hypothetical protein
VEEPVDATGKFGGPAVNWFVDPNQWGVYLAQDGPDDWQRIDPDAPGATPEARPVDDVEVSNVEEGEESISFDVDQVGTPILVKSSYFPNWDVSGAEGPYRVAPNFMVVVPTSEHVELSYGRTGVEYLSYGMTLLGLVGLFLLARKGTYEFEGPNPPPPRAPAPLPVDGPYPEGPWPYPGDPRYLPGQFIGDPPEPGPPEGPAPDR